MACFWKSDYSVWNIGANLLNCESTVSAIWIIYRGVIGILGSITFMIVFDFIAQLIKNTSCINEICRWGKVTLEIYILQALMVEIIGGKALLIIIGHIGVNPFTQNELLLGFVFAPLFAAISVGVIYRIQKLLKKIPVVGNWVFRLKISK